MDRNQFHNAIKRQDLHILSVSDSPPNVYTKLVRESEYLDHLFAEMHSERYKQPVYVGIGLPYKLDDNLMTIGQARQIAAHFMRELARAEMERAKNEIIKA